MIDLRLIYPTPDGSREIIVDAAKTSFGRGSDADLRFADDGLSRLHATIYREGDRIWIVDENSSNGTFVNGVRTATAGTPLRHGDVIRIGHQTEMRVRLNEVQPAASGGKRAAGNLSAIRGVNSGFFGIAVGGAAVAVAALAAIVVAVTYFSGGSESSISAARQAKDPGDADASETMTERRGNSNSQIPAAASPAASPVTPTVAESSAPIIASPSSKKYQEMTDAERRRYIAEKAVLIAQIIGNRSSDAIPPAAVDRIKSFADAYAGRAKVKPLAGACRFGDNLQSTFERASKNAPFIVKAFNEKGTDPRIGIYLAMIESEHCVCLQSPTGPLGMFQFTKSTGSLYGLKVNPNASPANPDERCDPAAAARASAAFMKSLTGRYGTGPSSVPLAIGSYNSGEGGLSQNLVKALESDQGLPRDFWTLIANGEKLSKQFQAENFKYVPKFFAAAIIGENPQDFGLSLQPLSTYSQ